MSKAKIPSSLKQQVRQRAEGWCEYCRAPDNILSSPFNAEHIRPEKDEGATDFANLAWSCGGCNGHKSAKQFANDPQTSQQVGLFNPRAQVWAEHFEWSAEFTEIMGRTPAGRATVVSLKMNRPNLVRLRRLLYNQGEHPARQNERG